MRLPIAACLLIAPTLLACTPRDDDYLLLRRAPAAGHRDDASTPLALAPPNDAEAYYLRHVLASGFGAELLRTYAMTKRFAARTSSYRETPTTIALGSPDAPARHLQPRTVRIGWWRTTIDADAPVIWVDDSPGRADRSTMADLVTGFGGAIADVIAPEGGDAEGRRATLRAGYIAFLQVVAAEWRPPRATDDRDDLRRLPVFADVRNNQAVRRRAGDPRAMILDPAVVATVLYRMASSGLGRQMADPAVYRPFLDARPPEGVHPALLLGAFRNFQAKLLAAWSRAAAANRRPHDLIDLVEAYADAYPAERAETMRIFLVTTYGATAVEDGVRADAAPERVASELATLTADVLFGTRGLRQGYSPDHR
jgi:hypothetical protein